MTTWGIGRFMGAVLAAMGLALAAAAQAQSVVVYSAVSPKVMSAFVEEFQKQNPGIKVELISGGSGELFTRLNAEKARPRADVLVGPDADNFDAYLDLFDGYKSKEDAAFPRSAIGPDNKYYGFSTNFQAFIVNTKMMPADKAPQTWSDLAKPEYKGKVVMANPAQSGSAYSQMQQILQLYNWDLMDKIVGVATFVPSSRLAYQNIAKGEMPIGLTSEFNIVASQAEGFPVVAIYPKDGTALINDASGIIKGGPNPENARKFLDFVNSKKAHEMIVAIDKRRSARSDVPPPAGLPPASTLKTFPYDNKAATVNRKANLERFDKVFASK
ncbi:MAG: extracellular solute-binding protein [Burkholderiales bacterium]|nr:extracellular solute-binding protein [Burkholderiales bacterium]